MNNFFIAQFAPQCLFAVLFAHVIFILVTLRKLVFILSYFLPSFRPAHVENASHLSPQNLQILLICLNLMPFQVIHSIKHYRNITKDLLTTRSISLTVKSCNKTPLTKLTAHNISIFWKYYEPVVNK